MKNVQIYTDGACSGNPGPGGWCAILIYGKYQKIISGGEKNTTNNKMELLAVIEGLKALKEKCKVEVYSDSAYVVNAFIQNWIIGWQKRNWKTANKEPVKNIELWEKLLKLTTEHDVKFIKVKGHADNYYNNKCDQIAVNEYKNL